MPKTTDSMAEAGTAERRCEYGRMLAACSVAMASIVPVALYQLGYLRHLADPPGAIFDSERITSSKAAHPAGIPDGLLGLANFASTFSLILAARQSSRARRLLGAKAAMDGGAAAFNLGRQAVSFRRLCSWCTVTSLATFGMVFAGRKTIADTLSLARNELSERAQLS